MSAIILDGKKLANKILEELKTEIGKLNVQIELAIVLVGSDPPSVSYVNQKQKTGKTIGIDVKIYNYEKNISTRKLREEINKLNKNKKITGIIVQLPLPNTINTESILDAVNPKKDVDVLNRESVGRLYKNKSKVLPPTIAGIKKILEEYKIECRGKNIAIVGYGILVGKPATIIFANEGASIFVVRSSTKSIEEILKQADIIISGVGKPNLITKNMLKKDAVVVDAGTSISEQRTANNKQYKKIIVGDVAEDVKDVAKYITPVPGGVGPMTVAMLFWNLLELIKNGS